MKAPSPTSASSLLACVAARVYLGIMLGLLVWTVLPLGAGWHTSMVMTGSMAPSLQPGDAIVRQPVEARALLPGQVVVVDDPDHPGRLRAHRLVETRPDGMLVLRGDANRLPDSTPVAPSAVQGLARLRVPYVALPAVWLRSGHPAYAGGWLLLTCLAVLLAASGGARRRDADDESPDSTDDPAIDPPPRAGWLRRRAPQVAGAVPVTVALLLAPSGTGAASAAYTRTTSNPTSSFSAAASFCSLPGTMTVNPSADTDIEEARPTRNNGGTVNLRVQSLTTSNMRTLVTFALPSVPARCTVIGATLTLNVTSGVTGRTLTATAAATTWTEGGVNWNTKPAPTGTSANIASVASGALTFTVTAHVLAMYSGSNFGFIVRDAFEASPTPAKLQTSGSRTGAQPPQLAVTFG